MIGSLGLSENDGKLVIMLVEWNLILGSHYVRMLGCYCGGNWRIIGSFGLSENDVKLVVMLVEWNHKFVTFV